MKQENQLDKNVTAFRYRIYYGDGTIYDSSSGKPIPSRKNIQVILQEDENGWFMQTRSDFYIQWEDRPVWIGVDLMGLYDWLLDRDDFRDIDDLYTYEVLSKDRWIRVDSLGLFKWLLRKENFLAGRTISTERYDEIFKHAWEDRSLPMKGTLRSREERPRSWGSLKNGTV